MRFQGDTTQGAWRVACGAREHLSAKARISAKRWLKLLTCHTTSDVFLLVSLSSVENGVLAHAPHRPLDTPSVERSVQALGGGDCSRATVGLPFTRSLLSVPEASSRDLRRPESVREGVDNNALQPPSSREAVLRLHARTPHHFPPFLVGVRGLRVRGLEARFSVRVSADRTSHDTRAKGLVEVAGPDHAAVRAWAEEVDALLKTLLRRGRRSVASSRSRGRPRRTRRGCGRASTRSTRRAPIERNGTPEWPRTPRMT